MSISALRTATHTNKVWLLLFCLIQNLHIKERNQRHLVLCATDACIWFPLTTENVYYLFLGSGLTFEKSLETKSWKDIVSGYNSKYKFCDYYKLL